MIELTTPAIIFPAISLLMLAYTNRFMVISQRIRSLHSEYQKSGTSPSIKAQISNLRLRFKLIRWMQMLGVSAFIICLVSMLAVLVFRWDVTVFFAVGVVFLIVSLAIALWEIAISTKAIEIELQDIEK